MNRTRNKRPLRALPMGLSMSDFFWEATPEETLIEFEKKRRQSRLAKLHRLELIWAVQDTERLRRRAAELAAIVAQDRIYVARVNAIEQEQKRVTDYWLDEQKKTAEVEWKALLAKAEKLGKEIRKSDVRAEREVLARRGVLRGRAR
jgi:hypothetical protein